MCLFDWLSVIQILIFLQFQGFNVMSQHRGSAERLLNFVADLFTSSDGICTFESFYFKYDKFVILNTINL